jgi:hypothetical protein
MLAKRRFCREEWSRANVDGSARSKERIPPQLQVEDWGGGES